MMLTVTPIGTDLIDLRPDRPPFRGGGWGASESWVAGERACSARLFFAFAPVAAP